MVVLHMTRDEALKICRVLGATYRRDDWSEERFEVWIALLSDLPYDQAQEAVLGWARNEKWPPSPAEIRALTFDLQAARAERERITTREMLRLPAAGRDLEPEEPLTVTQLHMWRASMGRPMPNCDCESCKLGRAILARRVSAAVRPTTPTELTEDELAEVERVRAWAEADA
jgi:hypothetical protein